MDGYFGPLVEANIDVRVGDLLETLKTDLPTVDLLLLDSEIGLSLQFYSIRRFLTICNAVWAALTLPALKTALPKLKRGAVILIDNTISGQATSSLFCVHWIASLQI